MKRQPRLTLIITLMVLVFLHAPLVVLVGKSFNASRFGGVWEGFTWSWYEKLWQSRDVWASVMVTLKIAFGATLSSRLRGTLAALALHRFRSRLQSAHHTLVMLPLPAIDQL